LSKSKKQKPNFSASFPGFVDLAVKNGNVRYLIKEEGKFKTESAQRYVCGGVVVFLQALFHEH